MGGNLISSPDGLVSGLLGRGSEAGERPLLVCIHGGGCNANYFDLRGNSVVAAAQARGFPVLAVNRPAYGGNRVLPGETPIADSVPVIRRFVDQVRATLPLPRGIVLIGHSIGGAIALEIAATRGDWPLLGLAVSGIGDESPERVRRLDLPDDSAKFTPPAEFTEALFHDPERQLSWKPLASLRAAAEPWLLSEVLEVVWKWPARWPALASRVDRPVHLRLAEHERIWETGAHVVERMAGSLSAAPRVDSGLLPAGGHLFEAYRGGADLVRAQLDFLESLSGPSGSGR